MQRKRQAGREREREKRKSLSSGIIKQEERRSAAFAASANLFYQAFPVEESVSEEEGE